MLGRLRQKRLTCAERGSVDHFGRRSVSLTSSLSITLKHTTIELPMSIKN